MKILSIKFDNEKNLKEYWDELKERLFEEGSMPDAGTLMSCKGGFKVTEVDDKTGKVMVDMEFPSMTREKLTFKKLQEIEKRVGRI